MPKVTDRQAQRRFFETEIHRLTDRLYATALRLTRSPDDAEDVVAEAVSRAWCRLDELRDPDRFEAWLFRILNNTFVSQWRKRRCRQDLETELDPENGSSDELQFSLFQQLHQPFLLWWGAPEQEVVEEFLREDIQRAIDHLPDEYRVTLVLVELQGYRYREVSELLDIPLGTVRSRLNRARSLLQKELWELARDAGIVKRGGS
ncbi:RNA polymerase sigma factor [Marinimicrobium sp. C2-29]|uniref:RNA polymerase sigma factor n=1 Tax=Marinimicrobium sp. C2-29 TaxID=3139825 RepID=UPI003138AC9A